MDPDATYADLCAYTIRHSLRLEEFGRSGGQHTVDTKRKAWTTIERLIGEAHSASRIVPVLFARAEHTADIVGAADLVSVQTGAANSFTFINFRYLDPPIRKTRLKLSDGRSMSRDFIRDYAICKTPPGLARYVSGPPTAPNGGAAEDIEKILADAAIPDSTTRMALVEARIGQGRFRASLIERWRGGCAVTRCSVLDVLRASHIKPWKYSDNRERLDPANGILLSANMDALFDSGLVSFDDRGRMLLSDRISTTERKRLGLPKNLARLPDAHERIYLAYHRQCFQFPNNASASRPRKEAKT